jgi:hypothetical protein
MRQELASWKLTVDKDKGGKTKASVKVRNDKRCVLSCFGGVCNWYIFGHQKKKASKSGKKKKKEKDLTSDR